MSCDANEFAQTTREVNNWLKIVYGDSPVPQFNVTKANVDILLKIKRASDISTKNISQIVDDFDKKIEEYQAETERISAIVNHVEITQQLSNKGRLTTRNLALAACSLQLKQPSQASFLVAVLEVDRELVKVQKEKVELERIVKQLNDTTVQTWDRVQQLRNLQPKVNEERNLQKEKSEKLQKKSDFMNAKVKDYDREVNKLESKYSTRGMEKHLKHQKLQEKVEVLKKSKKELSAISEKLQIYRGLPANTELAKVELEKLKEELEEITKKIFQQIPDNTL